MATPLQTIASHCSSLNLWASWAPHFANLSLWPAFLYTLRFGAVAVVTPRTYSSAVPLRSVPTYRWQVSFTRHRNKIMPLPQPNSNTLVGVTVLLVEP